MNTSKLIRAVSVKTGFSQPQIRFIYDAIIETITESIEQKARITLRGFGTLALRERQPYSGRNPATGEPINIPAKNIIRFLPARSLKENVPPVPAA